jgi:hypothetical protein
MGKRSVCKEEKENRKYKQKAAEKQGNSNLAQKRMIGKEKVKKKRAGE